MPGLDFVGFLRFFGMVFPPSVWVNKKATGFWPVAFLYNPVFQEGLFGEKGKNWSVMGRGWNMAMCSSICQPVP
jgi:hypothetical protein